MIFSKGEYFLRVFGWTVSLPYPHPAIYSLDLAGYIHFLLEFISVES